MQFEELIPNSGFRDLSPEQESVKNHVINLFTEAARIYGSKRITTSPVVRGSLMRKYLKQGNNKDYLDTPIPYKLVNTKEGKEKETKILRCDLTLPLLRYHVNAYGKGKGDIPKEPFKYFQVGDVWRAERPQRGRYRCFTQCDFDVIYSQRLSREEKDQIFCDFMVQIASIGYTASVFGTNILGSHGHPIYPPFFLRCRAPSDLLKKVCEVLEERIESKWERQKRHMPRERFDKEFNDYATILFDKEIKRSPSHYTDQVMELYIAEYDLAVGGGGCYDGLTKRLFDAEWGGVGFSFGIDRIVDARKEAEEK